VSRALAWKWASGLLLAALAVAACWKVLAMARADRLAATDPAAALAIEPTHGAALTHLAEAELRDGQIRAAQATARELLRHEPLAPAGWSVLAGAIARQAGAGAPDALAASRIAVRHAPRDLAARARLADAAMAAGDFPAAMVQFDVLLRLSRPLRDALVPGLVQAAAVPAFRDALAATLATDPTWRGALLAEMARHVDRPEVRGLYAALRARGGLDDGETTRWLDALIAKGEWGAAYAHWASAAAVAGEGLPTVFNGGFEQPLADSGFGWRLRKVSGSSASRQPRNDDQGHAARIAFQGRKVERAGLEQPLLLAPGRQVVRMQVHARNLRSEQGLEWVVQCPDGRLAGRSPALQGNFEWRPLEWSIEVPATGCPGQWLRLRNPAPPGAGRLTRGELWVDDISITPY